MKVLTIVGARPQFIKAAAFSRELRRHHQEILVHTGQHYDHAMSGVFFEQLEIPTPDVNLEVGSGGHGAQTGAMLTKTEQVLMTHRPDWVVIFGDTNSTLAGALAASKLHIPVAHVEAGLRSFNRRMPEEINRVVSDHLSSLLLCPSRTAVDNLATEGLRKNVHLVGDIMLDALNWAKDRSAPRTAEVLSRIGIEKGRYVLATVHRSENTDTPARLSQILSGLNAANEAVVFPVHPRTRKMIIQGGYSLLPHIHLIDPLDYMEMVSVSSSARVIVTDSGGLQKEAFWLGIPCITVRDETEWVETVDAGWNVLAGANHERIIAALRTTAAPQTHPALYGHGGVAARCIELMA